MRVKLENGGLYDTGFSLFSHDRCCLCGKAMEPEYEHLLLLTRTIDGSAEYAISSLEDASPEELKANLWIAPIGPDCLQRHQELNAAIVSNVPLGEHDRALIEKSYQRIADGAYSGVDWLRTSVLRPVLPEKTK